jgi:hypothetical protein
MGQQTMRDLGENTGAVAGLAVSVNAATVFHATDGLQSHLHNIVPGSAGGAGNEANTTSVVFKFGTIQQALGWVRHY